MLIEAEAINSIDLTEDRTKAKMIFRKKDKSTVEVSVPIDMFLRARSSYLRVVEARKQQRHTTATGIQEVSFSIAKTITPRADVVARRIYLIVDGGTPNEVAYAISMLDGLKLGLEIYTEAQRWLAANQSADDVKQ